MTETECFGKVTTKVGPLGTVVCRIEIASGREKSFATASEEAVMVCTSACATGLAPWTVIVVRSALVELVFTALMKIALPSLVWLAVASR